MGSLITKKRRVCKVSPSTRLKKLLAEKKRKEEQTRHRASLMQRYASGKLLRKRKEARSSWASANPKEYHQQELSKAAKGLKTRDPWGLIDRYLTEVIPYQMTIVDDLYLTHFQLKLSLLGMYVALLAEPPYKSKGGDWVDDAFIKEKLEKELHRNLKPEGSFFRRVLNRWKNR